MHPRDFFKDFFKKAPPLVNAGYIFLVMPFAKEFDVVHNAIKTALESERENDEEELGFHCYRANEEPRSGIIMEKVLQQLREAEVVIADLTGSNANVFYELGIAHMAKDAKYVVLISQDDWVRVPFDVRSYSYFKYTLDNLSLLQQYLIKTVKEVTPARKRITKPLNDPYETWIEGKDGSLYRVSICVVGVVEGGAARVQIKLWREDQTQQPLFEDRVLHPWKEKEIPRTHWAVKLHGVSSGKAEFCICDAHRLQT